MVGLWGIAFFLTGINHDRIQEPAAATEGDRSTRRRLLGIKKGAHTGSSPFETATVTWGHRAS